MIVLIIILLSVIADIRVAVAEPSVAPLIIPQPKSVRLQPGRFVWAGDSDWRLTLPAADDRLNKAVGTLLPAAHGSSVVKSGAGFCLQAGPGATGFPEVTAGQGAWATNPEGYRISVSSRGLEIHSSTAQGLFYGLQTLGQIMESSNAVFSCPCLEIEDWPSLRFRGVHWFPSASGVPMYRRLIENVFSPLKLNHCVIECEAARWDSCPAMALPNAISKADLRGLVEDCRACYLEPIPLVDVPGHARWLFHNGQNRDLAEDPATLYACCVRNPKAIQLVENVMAECLDVFHPQTFHIGHDEITDRGDFPNPQCPFCHGASIVDLTAESANRLQAWLAERGVATMMWGDMLLAHGEAADATAARSAAEARQLRAAISKHIAITDWHYTNPSDRSLTIFQQAGFRTIAATWFQPTDISKFAQAAVASGSEGLLQTTWDGFYPDERAMRGELRQFAAYVLAAEYAWSGREDPPESLAFDAKAIFLKAYAGKFARMGP